GRGGDGGGWLRRDGGAEAIGAAVGAAGERHERGEHGMSAPRALVKRHHWIVRLTHWGNTIVLIGMVASGPQSYRGYTRFGLRGTRLPVPNPFEGRGFPEWSRLGGWLAGGLNWHFFLMWPLVLNGLLYLGYMLFSGELKTLAFRPRDIPRALQ